MIEAVTVCCPYCWQTFETTIDLSAGNQEYIEDCYVCCRPIRFRVAVNDFELLAVETFSVDE